MSHLLKMDKHIPINSSVPPKENEYAYFLTKLHKTQNAFDNKNKKYYRVLVEDYPDLILPCHYSLKNYFEHKPFLVSWGKIISVLDDTKDNYEHNYTNFNYS